MLNHDLPAALVFDLDGTIVDTETPEFESIRTVWADHGAVYTHEHFQHVVGTADGVETWFEELVELIDTSLDRPTAEARRRSVHRTMIAALHPRDGISELVHSAAERSIPMAVASNSPRWWVVERLASVGLAPCFSALVTFDDVEHPKPHPEPFLRACAFLEVEPARSIAFEDSVTGVASARAAGLFTVACPGPITTGHDLSAADLLVASHADISLADLARAVRG